MKIRVISLLFIFINLFHTYSSANNFREIGSEYAFSPTISAPTTIASAIIGSGLLVYKGIKHLISLFKNKTSNFEQRFKKEGLLPKSQTLAPTIEQQVTIMGHLELYNNREFIAFIQTLPDYSTVIQDINSQIQNNTFIYSKNISAHLKQNLAKLATQAKNSQQASLILYNDSTPFINTLKKSLTVREKAYLDIKNNQAIILSKQYTLTAHDEHTLSTNGYDPQRYRYCEGNQLNQALHEETLQILSMVSKLPDQHSDLCQDIYAFNDTGLLCNHTGNTDRAIMFIDLCWSLLDFAKHGAQGMIDGSLRAVKTIMDHPIATIFTIAATRGLLAAFPTLANVIGPYGIALQLSIIVADIGFAYWQDPAQGIQKWHDYTNRFNIILDWLTNKQTNYHAQEAFGQSVSIATEWVVENKILHCLSAFFSKASNQATKLAQKFPAGPEHVMTTPEGVQIKFADRSISPNIVNTKSCKKIVETTSTNNHSVPNYIKEKRFPFDHETILKNEKLFRCTGKVETKCKTKVYKHTVNGRLYHRDKLHTGAGAHLEVYDARGNHLGIADPVLGELIPNTQVVGRKLKV